MRNADIEALRHIQRQIWQDILYKVCQEATLIASSRHILYIGKKPSDERE